MATVTVLRAAVLISSLTACSSGVVTDYNIQLDYNQFKTYQFPENTTNSVITLDSARVEKAIKLQLDSKGMKKTDNNADIIVHHYIQQQSDFRSYGTTVGFGYRYRHVGMAYSSPSQFREYRYGKLVVELIENTSNNIVWKAISQRKLTETMTPGSRNEFIDEQISKMFKSYPPQKSVTN
ncbi:DUF4136 domain-containing protein [Photobacterium sp. J15]|uniref:DUF4136 domain-containing protein n=1 Tax=Photobacterium sp. J15 TaxID=265901 RepID=UPI0007E43145|nr:DUF4136 domain-containing protein [Photobacterium sp. J15]